jgi:hypothetical protein
MNKKKVMASFPQPDGILHLAAVTCIGPTWIAIRAYNQIVNALVYRVAHFSPESCNSACEFVNRQVAKATRKTKCLFFKQDLGAYGTKPYDRWTQFARRRGLLPLGLESGYLLEEGTQ